MSYFQNKNFIYGIYLDFVCLLRILIVPVICKYLLVRVFSTWSSVVIIFSSPELKARSELFWWSVRKTVCRLNFHILIFSRITGPISTKLGTKHPSMGHGNSSLFKWTWRSSLWSWFLVPVCPLSHTDSLFFTTALPAQSVLSNLSNPTTMLSVSLCYPTFCIPIWPFSMCFTLCNPTLTTFMQWGILIIVTSDRKKRAFWGDCHISHA